MTRRAFAAAALWAALSLAGCGREPEGPDEPAVVYDSPSSERTEVGAVGTMTQEGYPAGCEVVALINALHKFGIDLSFGECYALFDHSRTDFVHAWWGDPCTEGAAYPPALAEAAGRALSGTCYEARDATGETMEAVADALTSGGCAVAWYTTDGGMPAWSGWEVDGWEMYANEHAVTVASMGGGSVTVMDPLTGMRDIPVDEFTDVWTACGSMVVTIK